MNPKPLIGAVAGAFVGAAVWYWLESSTPPTETSWVPLLMGVLSGLGAKVFAEPILNNRRRGATVAVLALVSMLVAQRGIAAALASQFDESPVSSEFAQPSTTEPSTPPEGSSNTSSGSGDAAGTTDVASDDQQESVTDELPKGADNRMNAPIDPDEIPTVNGMPMRPTTIDDYRPADPRQPVGQQLLLLLSFAAGTFLAYGLGKGPRLKALTVDAASPSNVTREIT